MTVAKSLLFSEPISYPLLCTSEFSGSEPQEASHHLYLWAGNSGKTSQGGPGSEVSHEAAVKMSAGTAVTRRLDWG